MTTVQRTTVRVGGAKYKVVDSLPHSHMQLVRRNFKPGTERTIHDVGRNELLALTITSSEGTSLRQALNGLAQEGARDLDGLVRDVVKASALGVPVSVSIARLGLITNNVRAVVKARLAADHAQLKANLLPASVPANFDAAFDGIEIPGSDPHKGGQVVVFVSYRLQAGGAHKIVYKPSDLTVDSLLSSDDPTSIASKIGPQMAKYKIMPMTDPAATDRRLAHYGYMEFVKSETPQTQSDMLGVYQGLGRGLAVGFVFGLRDMHYQNYLMTKNNLLFFDLEAATGTYSSFDAMEILYVPASIAERIGRGMRDLKPDAAAAAVPSSDALKQAALNGAQSTLTRLGSMHYRSARKRFARATARFVPFPTPKLQQIAGAVHGQIPANPTAKQQTDYQVKITALLNEEASSSPQLWNDLRLLLDAASTRAAFNKGDVPYFMRQGDTIYGEAGEVLIAALATHPRVAPNVRAQVETRKANTATGLTDFQNQVLPKIDNPHQKIIDAYTFAGAGAPAQY